MRNKNKQSNENRIEYHDNLTNVHSNDIFLYIGYTTDGSGINHMKYNKILKLC